MEFDLVDKINAQIALLHLSEKANYFCNDIDGVEIFAIEDLYYIRSIWGNYDRLLLHEFEVALENMADTYYASHSFYTEILISGTEVNYIG